MTYRYKYISFICIAIGFAMTCEAQQTMPANPGNYTLPPYTDIRIESLPGHNLPLKEVPLFPSEKTSLIARSQRIAEFNPSQFIYKHDYNLWKEGVGSLLTDITRAIFFPTAPEARPAPHVR